jgi:large-conductance mechanosensitive channel
LQPLRALVVETRIDSKLEELVMSNVIRTGAAFAITVAVGYALCTLVFWIWPEVAAGFMNALFHGLDFRKLQSGPAAFSFGSFLYALVVMAMWAFGLGTLFSWLFARLGGAR